MGLERLEAERRPNGQLVSGRVAVNSKLVERYPAIRLSVPQRIGHIKLHGLWTRVVDAPRKRNKGPERVSGRASK